jgi:hypothetical protein
MIRQGYSDQLSLWIHVKQRNYNKLWGVYQVFFGQGIIKYKKL